MFERILPIRGFNKLQRVEQRFRRISGVERDATIMYGEVLKEVAELGEAIKTKDRFEIQCEVADIIINLSELANAEGFRLSDAVTGKVRRNADKYNPYTLKYYQILNGWTPAMAMIYAKSQWDKERDRAYFAS